MVVQYENLTLIPKMFDLIVDLKKEIEVLKTYKPDLKNGKEVYTFLGIGKTTLYRLINDNVLKQGVHYNVKHGKKVFVEEEIINFKKEYVKYACEQKNYSVSVNEIINRLSA